MLLLLLRGNQMRANYQVRFVGGVRSAAGGLGVTPSTKLGGNGGCCWVAPIGRPGSCYIIAMAMIIDSVPPPSSAAQRRLNSFNGNTGLCTFQDKKKGAAGEEEMVLALGELRGAAANGDWWPLARTGIDSTTRTPCDPL